MYVHQYNSITRLVPQPDGLFLTRATNVLMLAEGKTNGKKYEKKRIKS